MGGACPEFSAAVGDEDAVVETLKNCQVRLRELGESRRLGEGGLELEDARNLVQVLLGGVLEVDDGLGGREHVLIDAFAASPKEGGDEATKEEIEVHRTEACPEGVRRRVARERSAKKRIVSLRWARRGAGIRGAGVRGGVEIESTKAGTESIGPSGGVIDDAGEEAREV